MSVVVDQLGKRVRRSRRAREWSQADLAAATGCSRQTIVSIESGRQKPKSELARRLASVLDLGDVFGELTNPTAHAALRAMSAIELADALDDGEPDAPVFWAVLTANAAREFGIGPLAYDTQRKRALREQSAAIEELIRHGYELDVRVRHDLVSPTCALVLEVTALRLGRRPRPMKESRR